MLEKVQTTLREILNQPTLEIQLSTVATDVPGWDSLAHLNLVAALEQDLSIRFALGELRKMQNVGDLVAILEKKVRKSS